MSSLTKSVIQTPVEPLKSIDDYRVEAIQRLESNRFLPTPRIGLEIEFFLRDHQGNLATLAQSQAFLERLARVTGWGVFQRSVRNDRIIALSKDLPHGRYHSLKYEHPPHLMEIALSYESNLVDLKSSLELALNDIFVAASSSQVECDFTPNCEYSSLNWSEVSEINLDFESRNLSRIANLEFHGVSSPPSDVNFPAFTASTQFHISGYHWWRDEKFIHRFYQSEFAVSQLAFSNFEIFQERWRRYQVAFPYMRSVGIPGVEHWSSLTWIQTLIDDNPLQRQLFLMRDFQLIKPKWIGTLETRSDPSTRDTDLIMQLAALRFGQYLLLSSQAVPPQLEQSLVELKRQWLNPRLFQSHTERLEITKRTSWETLKNRGLGEEKFL